MKLSLTILALTILVSASANADTCVLYMASDDYGECGWSQAPFVYNSSEFPAGACAAVDGSWTKVTSGQGWVDCSWNPQPDDGNSSWPVEWTETYTKPVGGGGSCTSPRYPPGWQAWTDAAVTAGSTKLSATHINQLRNNINLMRTDAGLAVCAWTDPTITSNVTKIRKVHIDEIRTCISQVYTACGQGAPAFTDAVITAGTTKIKKIHLDELRSATQNAP